MDAISYSKAAQQEQRLTKFINEPDSTSGLVTLPSTIASGQVVNIPTGRQVVVDSLDVQGTLNINGKLATTSGGSLSQTTMKTQSIVNSANSASPVDFTVAPTVSGTALRVTNTSTLTLGTAVASTSGTSIDFTGIPSWAKRITMMFNGVSTSGASVVQIQLGSGSIQTSGYLGAVTNFNLNALSTANHGSGFYLDSGTSAAAVSTRHGKFSFELLSNNIYVASGSIGFSNATYSGFIGGSVTLSGTLDRVRITTVNGTDTFDAGSINIMWE